MSGNFLRVAIAGAGMISEFHLKAWARVPDAKVIAVVDPDPARARARAAQFGVPSTYRDIEALFAAEEVDALDVATPRETHTALVLAAAERGVAVLCQKPLAPTLAEAEALVATLGSRIRLMVHENWRFRPYYRQIAAWIAEGRLGPLSTATISIRSSGLLPDADGLYPAIQRQPFFRTERRLLVAESLIHHVDVARWLFGPLRLLAARLRRATEVVAGESAATLMFEAADGAPLVVDGNYATPGFPPAARDRVELVGTAGTIVLRDDRLELLGDDPIAIEYRHAEAYQACFDAAIAHFVQGLKTGAPFETSPEDNLETLRLVEAAYSSSGRRE